MKRKSISWGKQKAQNNMTDLKRTCLFPPRTGGEELKFIKETNVIVFSTAL